MMEANHVTAFFHGHDHQMAYEKLNGMVYQAVPSGSFTGSFNMYTTGGNSGNTIWADSTQGPGHLKVTVGPTQTTVDFIRYNGSTPVSGASYTMAPTTTTSKLGGVNSDGVVNSTDALIILSADVGIKTPQFCPMNCGDVNNDGFVNSTDALIILSYDVGISVPFPVGTGACPSSVTQPSGCTP
jgi:hypothetical protein